MSVETELRRRARELLETGEVKLVLGFRAGRRPQTTVPAFVTGPEQAEELVLNLGCAVNLAVYLPKLRTRGRIAVVARGRDSRSIVNLIKENQVDRANLHIIGVVDPDPSQAIRNPVLYDEMIGERVTESHPDDYVDIREFENLKPRERWDVLTGDLSRCIRCYACRQACPNCYCPTCFVDADRPLWVGRTPDESDTILFHIMRAMHMAGRCVECEACALACPMGIELMRINRKMAVIVKDRFDHVSGMNLDDPLPLTAFDPADREAFVK